MQTADQTKIDESDAQILYSTRVALRKELVAFLKEISGKEIAPHQIVDKIIEKFNSSVNLIKEHYEKQPVKEVESEEKLVSLENLKAEDFIRLMKVYPVLDKTQKTILLQIAQKIGATTRSDVVEFLAGWLTWETNRPRVTLFLEVLKAFEAELSPPIKKVSEESKEIPIIRESPKKEKKPCQMFIMATGKSCEIMTDNFIERHGHKIALCPIHAEYHERLIKANKVILAKCFLTRLDEN